MTVLLAGGLSGLGDGHRSALDGVAAFVAVAAACAVALRAARVPHDRTAWILLGTALAGGAAGALGASPDWAVGVYDLAAIAGTTLLLQSYRHTWSDALDAISSGLATAAAAATVIDVVSHGDFDHEIVVASGDLVLVALAVTVLVAHGRHAGGGVWLLAAGLVGTALADAFLLGDEESFGEIAAHPSVAARPLCAVAVAVAAWYGRRSWSERRETKAAVPLATPFAVLLALAVLLTDTLTTIGRLPHILSALAIVTATARTVLTLRRQTTDAERLRSAEEQYRTLVERMPAVTYIADLGEHGDWHYISPQVEELLGYAAADFENRSSLWIELVHPDDRARVVAAEAALRLEGTSLDTEYRMVARDGRTVHVRDEAVKIGAKRALGFLLDVTARRRAELDAHRRSAQQSLVANLGQRALAGATLRELFDEPVAGTATALEVELAEVLELLPGDGRLLRRAGVGWQAGLNAGVINPDPGSLAEVTLSEGRPVVVRDLRVDTRFSVPTELHRHGVVSGISTVIRDGRVPFGVLGAYTVRSRGFTPADVDFLEGVAHALTAAVRSRRTEEEIRQADRRFRRVLEGAPDGIVGVDRSGRVALANERAAELFRDDRLVGRAWRELGADLPALPASGTQLTARRADGSEFAADVSVSALENDVLLLASVRDVSERVREQDERDQLRAQLEQSQRLETIGQLAGGIAHDFNNVLQVIQSHATFLAGRVSDQRAHDDVAKIAAATESATALTRQLIQFSNRRRVEHVLVDVNDVVERVHRLLDRSLGAGVRLSLELAAELPPVKVDPSQLEQVLMNLAVNARDAMPEGGEVRITTELVRVDSAPAHEEVRIRVRDTGVGMTAEVRDHIFDAFFTTKPPDRGTGLGLATVQRIVMGAGGHLIVRSEPGAGTEIDVCLPARGEEIPSVMSPPTPSSRSRVD